MKILLLNPPFKENFIRSARSTWPSISGSNWYPIFLAYAAGWLEKHGHQVKLIDALVSGMNIEDTIEITADFNPQIIALYVSEQSLINDIGIGTKIKKLTKGELFLVGPWCSVNPEQTLKENPLIDGIVSQEFDQVLLALADKKDKKTINGLVFRQAKKIIATPAVKFLTEKQLDEFPFVTGIYKKYLPITKYYQASLLHPFVDLFTGLGCSWGKCTFCLWPHTIHSGSNYRTRSLKKVIEELKYIKNELPEVKEIFFQDDTLPSFRAKEISKAIIKEKLIITWSCYSRADMDLETLKLMKQAGCRFLHVGYESANQNILKMMCKGTTLEQMKQFTENAKKAGLRIHGDFILGLPGETENTIKETIAWAKSLKIEGYQFFIPQPQKGTPLYQYLKSKKYLSDKGEVNYPHLSYEQLCSWRFKAMREIYFSPNYFFNTLKNINSLDDLLRLVRTGAHAIPKMFGRLQGVALEG